MVCTVTYGKSKKINLLFILLKGQKNSKFSGYIDNTVAGGQPTNLSILKI